MAKGAAKEATLGGLHSLLTKVFQRTLDKYLMQLDAIDKLQTEDLEAEMVAAVISEIGEPNPAMLSAITKFLKDNDIGMDTEEIENLNSTQRRLQERREERKRKGINLSLVPAVEAS